MTHDLRALAAAVVDVWNGGAPDRIHALLAPDYRGHMLHAQDGDRDGPVYVDAIGPDNTGAWCSFRSKLLVPVPASFVPLTVIV